MNLLAQQTVETGKLAQEYSDSQSCSKQQTQQQLSDTTEDDKKHTNNDHYKGIIKSGLKFQQGWKNSSFWF